MKLKLSAIVPVYNVENYLEACLDSIAGQIVPFDEVILVNDGSTDNSRKICEKYCNKFSNFTMINQNNKGLSEARNVGINMSSGDYILFIDADDIVRKNMLFVLKSVLDENEYDTVLFNADIWYDERRGEPLSSLKRGERFYGKDICGTDYLLKAFPGEYIVPVWVAVYKRKFIQDNGIYFQKGIYFEDHDFSLRIYLMAKKIICINEALYIRRCRNGSIMTDKNSSKKCSDLIKVNLTIWDIMKKSGLSILFQIHFVSYYFISVWRTIKESSYYEEVRGEWNHLLMVFHDIWLDWYLSEEIVFEDQLALLLFYSEWGGKKVTNIKEVKKQVENKVIHILRKIPLHDVNETVGIYGIGNHTVKMLELYKKFIGEMLGKVFFIVTDNKRCLGDYRGYPLVVPDDIPKETDQIVISSLIYQKDMYELLIKADIAEEKIVKLYEDNEFCDLAVVAKILEL